MNVLYQPPEIDQLIKEYALEGKIVARLKGGDATIFAHLSEDSINIKDQFKNGE